jgi:quercetin dioxygenase-like cupin family protein
MEIRPKTPAVKGPREMFTGDVTVEAIAYGEEPSRVRVNHVHFAPSARTAWHSHALGQTLYVTEGVGLMQARGGAISEMRVGDVVYTPSDEWHWHGASPDEAMSHISVTEGVGEADRPESEWGEHVSDEEYGGRRSG